MPIHVCIEMYLLQLQAAARRPSVLRYVMIPLVPPKITGPNCSRDIAAGTTELNVKARGRQLAPTHLAIVYAHV